MGARVTTPMFNFGLWVAKSNNTVYYAESPGFVCAYNSSSVVDIIGYTDSSNPPTTIRGGEAYQYGTTQKFLSGMPVRKGDYWKVTGASSVDWISIIS